MNIREWFQRTIGIALILLLLVGCSAPGAVPTPAPPTRSAAPTSIPPTATPIPPATTPAPSPTATPTAGPTDAGSAAAQADEEADTLRSLERVDDYPLYTMHYYGAYRQTAFFPGSAEGLASASGPDSDVMAGSPAWACSLLAALGDASHMLYGRNFDWHYSPAVLLFTDPPDGYAAVTMVDIAYLFEPAEADALTALPLAERRALLELPFWPFDGMNEHGLVVGMAAVPGSAMPYDPDKETTDSLMVMREILDHARDVDEALALLQSYNIDMGGGPPLHYLIADATGQAVLVEFYQGEVILIPNETPWHLATNFLRTTAGETGQGECRRYDRIYDRLGETGGQMTAQDAVDLLEEVSQSNTQWSVVYEMSSGDVHVVMGREYEDIHTFHLGTAGR